MTTYLEERLEWYDHNYRIGNALITDKQFDQLEKNLLRIEPDCDYFTNKTSLPLSSLKKEFYWWIFRRIATGYSIVNRT